MGHDKIAEKDLAAKLIGYAFWDVANEEQTKHAYSKPSQIKEAFRAIASEMAKQSSPADLLAIESFSGFNLRDILPQEDILSLSL
jgi:hypothetical protein